MKVIYKDYVKKQKGGGCSLESDNLLWRNGQIRFIKKMFGKLDRDKILLDIACGDGVGLRQFKKMSFKNVIGVEFNEVKAKLAKKIGYEVLKCDMHDLRKLDDKTFDVIYSSHTLEHAYDIGKVLKEFRRILKSDGLLVVVLPYPDMHDFNREIHVAKHMIGLDKDNDGKSVVKFFENNGFLLKKKTYDYYREPEIWLEMTKVNV